MEKAILDFINKSVDERIKKLIANLDRNTQKLISSMADKKWSGFPNASSLTGSEIWVGLQGGINIKDTLNDLKSFILSGIGNIYTPVFANQSGITSISNQVGFYTINNKIITAFSSFTIIADGSGTLMQMTMSNPMNANFSNANQGAGTGNMIKTSNASIPGAIGDGICHPLTASTLSGAGMNVILEGAAPSVSYNVSVSWQCQIQ